MDTMPDPTRNVVDGVLVDPGHDDVTELLDPATEDVVGAATRSRADDVDRAVAAAARAFPGWAATTPGERSRALLRLADLVEEHAEELAALEVAVTGKPLALTVAEEILPSADQLRYFAAAGRCLEAPASGEYLAGHTSVVRREPLGVCAQVTPWNYPLMMAVWKIGPALATGNTVVLKPAETTPTTTVRLAQLAADVVPAGVFNVVCGDRDTGRALVRHPDVALVSLTGSTRAGAEVGGAAGGLLKRLHLELGGNAAVVVCADADLESAAADIAASAFFNAGQDCVAASRVLVDARVHDEFAAAVVAAAEGTRAGGPAEPDADYGPLNNADQLARVEALVAGLGTHAEVRTGGGRLGERGYLFAPTVVTGVRQDDAIVQDELFAPMLTVQPFRDLDEALLLANGVPQGLSASVWTRDLATSARLSRELRFGCVWINTHLRFAAEMPHGGVKASGYGKDLSRFSLDDYTSAKHVMTAW
ncbi:betaine-aldehyde dehydrogenase [Jatrophihabitans endophyticus]|uniref:Betaine-aldehyde dehydrogenase n=1 Tax=Jatrophihabitans endophyticus TaxID=1206085 RepID=A0A1M5CRZ8_9ACTN|nr:aminobutyraldehyde dehydrogenase [Jatrophihabitans endophyticus]SHF57493.1 betaine-aldehyde dehydrogenase [Jatrophihabitans endophyticus]